VSDRVLARVVCKVHGVGMGRVRQTDAGALFEVRGRSHHDPYAAIYRKTRSGPWIPDPFEGVEVLLSSPEAERYDNDQHTWGKLPAWCPKCLEWRWVELEALRRGDPDILA
jgi:hypothetical protein